jgi:hypothetical protein
LDLLHGLHLRERQQGIDRTHGGAKSILFLLRRILLFEELRHELLLNLIQLPECRLQSRPVFIGSFAEDVSETSGGALHEQFRIF